jgi:hypothetical protein
MNEKPQPSRRDRIGRVRMRVLAGGTALFLAALGAVSAFGRQPATKVAHASTSSGSSGAASSTQTYDDGSSSYDDGSSSSADGSSSYDNGGSYAPTPMTSRSS